MRSLAIGVLVASVLAHGLTLSIPPAATAAGTHLAIISLRVHDDAHTVVTSVPAGTRIHARVVIGSDLKTDPVPTGQVRVTYYEDAACSALVISAVSTLVNGSQDPAGLAATPRMAGSGSFTVIYGGDPVFAPVTSGCRDIAVTKATPSFSLWFERQAGGAVTTVEAGEDLRLVMHVSGASGINLATGDVVVQYYLGDSCIELHDTVDDHFFDGKLSSMQAFYIPGLYSAQVTYDGDANWLPGVSGCAPITVVKRNPHLTTIVHDAAHAPATTVEAGGAVHPSVDLNTFIQVAPTGVFRARAFADASCSTPLGVPVEVPVLKQGNYTGVADITALTVSATPGVHAFRVEYLGNPLINGVVGACTAYTVTGGTQSPTMPAPTARATALPSAPPASTASAPTATAAAAVTAGPAITAGPGMTAQPAVTAGPAITADPPMTAGPPITAGPATGDPQPTQPSVEPVPAGARDGGLLPVIALVLVAVVALGASAFIAQRRQRSTG